MENYTTYWHSQVKIKHVYEHVFYNLFQDSC